MIIRHQNHGLLPHALLCLLLGGLGSTSGVSAAISPPTHFQEAPSHQPEELPLALPPIDPTQLIPRPAELRQADAVFLLGSHATVVVDAGAIEAHPIATRLARQLRLSTGQSIPIELSDVSDAEFGAWIVRLRTDRTEFGTEGYRIKIEPEQARLVAATPAGLLAGFSTLRQLLPASELEPGEPPRELLLRCLRIQDGPRVPERGLNLEIGDHALSKKELLRLVQQLAHHKWNELHLTGNTSGLSEKTLRELRQAANREGITLFLNADRGEPDAAKVLYTLKAPLDWEEASKIPELRGTPTSVKVHVRLDDIPAGQLASWLWPRLIALAESAWTQTIAPNNQDFSARLTNHLDYLSAEGIQWFVPAPERMGTERVFEESAILRLHNPGPVGSVRATLDGSPVTYQSPVIAGPLTLTESGRVRARVFIDKEHVSSELDFSVVCEPALLAEGETPQGLAPGLEWEAFDKDLSSNDDMTLREPLVQGWASRPARPSNAPDNSMVIRFHGWIEVPQTGTYSLGAHTRSPCALVLGQGESARRFEFSEGGPVTVETVLGAGTHRAQLLWWPTPYNEPPRLSWHRTHDRGAEDMALAWLAPTPDFIAPEPLRSESAQKDG